MEGKCQTIDVVYGSRVTSPAPRKIYFGLGEGKWKQRYYYHKKIIQSQTIFTWDDTFKLYKTCEETLSVTLNLNWSVSSAVHHISLKYLKKVSFVFVWKIGYCYLPKTTRIFTETIEAIFQMTLWFTWYCVSMKLLLHIW